MAKMNRTQALDSVVFRCLQCKQNFERPPQVVEDAPDCEWHPYTYSADCPSCGEECGQASYQRNLLKAWSKSNGPKSKEGKAAVRQNLAGHPTPEEAQRTRFNAMKHGMNARVARYFPSKPDGYPACKTCDIDRQFCQSQPACQQQTQLYMVHHAAFEQRDPRHLTSIYSDIQSTITAVVQQILQTIVIDGVVLRSPSWKLDQEGNVVIGSYVDETGQTRTIYEVHSHPLLRSLQDFLSKNGMSLADMGMTPKVVQEEEEAMGNLAIDESNQQSLIEYQQRSAVALEDLAALARKANAKRDQDPVLIEYRQQNGDANV